MDVRKDMEVLETITGEELIPSSCLDEKGKEVPKAIPTALLKGEKGEKGDKGEQGEPGPAGKDGYVTKEMYDKLVERISSLENSAVQISTPDQEQKEQNQE